MRIKSVVALVFLVLILLFLSFSKFDVSPVAPIGEAADVGDSGTAGAAKVEAVSGAGQDEMAVFRGNECVWCHSRLSSPLRLTSRYAEWHISTHKVSGISCDKCHGGSPKEADQNRAHAGMLPASNPASRLNPKNLSVTCRECHQPFVAAFIESKHYQASKGQKWADLSPSCNTCHAHMASEVIYTPEQTAEMCAKCHDATNSGLPRNPGMGTGANEAMQAIRRASMIVAWADRLLDEAGRRKMDPGTDQEEMRRVRALMGEAKAGFHTFETGNVRQRADAVYEQGTRLKDALRKKLYPNQ
ncbi:MAG: cytochrome c3 family protein [Blastocatellia bacterium]